MCFPVNFTKFLRTPSFTEHLRKTTSGSEEWNLFLPPIIVIPQNNLVTNLKYETFLYSFFVEMSLLMELKEFIFDGVPWIGKEEKMIT